MRRFTSSLLFAVLFAVARPVAAQPLAVGSSLPEGDRSLEAADGSRSTLQSLTGENGLVVVFWSNVCPWTERYTDRLVALARDYAPAGVGFVAVNANDSTRFPEEDVAAMRQTARQAGFTFPYVVDPGSALARAFGAVNAPEVFFFDAGGVLRYEGAMDSSPADPSRVQTAYLREAMDLVLAGQPVGVQSTNALGCTIKTAE